MIFTSFSYIIFLTSVVTFYYIAPKTYRWVVLLISSVYFYSTFSIAYTFLLLGIIIGNYLGALFLLRNNNKNYFYLIITLNIALLIFYKYLIFIINAIFQAGDIFLVQIYTADIEILAPVAISFYTFHIIGYVTDVFTKKIKPESNLGLFMVYILFFPKLIAGPIERPSNFFPQLKKSFISLPFFIQGLQLITLGFFKKVVIADRLGVLVDTVFSQPQQYVGISLVVAMLAYTFQLYCDFSGLIDIARGSARLLGFDLLPNFNFPYIASSITDFWRRWHISLSSWLRDYVYIPLGGNRVSRLVTYRNIGITFLISGIWHGVGWTFIVWGLLHGLYVILTEVFTSLDVIKKIKKTIFTTAFGIITTFSFVSVTWVIFRASTISDAWYIISHLFVGVGAFVNHLLHGDFITTYALLFGDGLRLGISYGELCIAIGALAFLGFFEYFESKKINTFFQWILYIVLVMWVINASFFTEQPFIYVQF